MKVRSASLVGATVVLVLGGAATAVMASAPSGVTPTVLARGTYDEFKLRADPQSPVEIKSKTKSPVDLVVRQHVYAIDSTTGWHTHPGPVFITVAEGELTYYLYDDPTCTPHVLTAGQGILDDGSGHLVRNESGAPAKDVSVIFAPVGGSFRGELDAPAPQCGF